MATPLLPPDFKEFLRLLNKNGVEYLLIGGYAVGYYGYVRATADMDIWIAANENNATKVVQTLREFGFTSTAISKEVFLQAENIVRMGVPPFRLEVLNTISGVEFADAYVERVVDRLDEVEVAIISLRHLKINKQASGRLKDLADLEHLP